MVHVQPSQNEVSVRKKPRGPRVGGSTHIHKYVWRPWHEQRHVICMAWLVYREIVSRHVLLPGPERNKFDDIKRGATRYGRVRMPRVGKPSEIAQQKTNGARANMNDTCSGKLTKDASRADTRMNNQRNDVDLNHDHHHLSRCLCFRYQPNPRFRPQVEHPRDHPLFLRVSCSICL